MGATVKPEAKGEAIEVHWRPGKQVACGNESGIAVGPGSKWVTCRECLEKAAIAESIGKEAGA